jgi:hypothetical protein
MKTEGDNFPVSLHFAISNCFNLMWSQSLAKSMRIDGGIRGEILLLWSPARGQQVACHQKERIDLILYQL